jgi:hypothetical protein
MLKQLSCNVSHVSGVDDIALEEGQIRLTFLLMDRRGWQLAEGLNVNAGTLNPHLPKRMISSIQILDWLKEPEG